MDDGLHAMPDLSLIVPVLNEAETISLFLAAIRPVLDDIAVSYEIIFVDDGSTDATAAVVSAEAGHDPRIRLVRLSRNFGKEAALTAGLDWSSGAAVIPIDVDLQDPPELIADFVRYWREGHDIVYGQRVDRTSDTGAKRMTAGLFYRIFNILAATKIDENAGDFRLLSRPAVDATLQLRERNRFMKGLFAWVGFSKIAVPYQRPERAAGTSKFSYWRLWNFALDGITSFSTMPLKSGPMSAFSSRRWQWLYTGLIMIRTIAFGRDVPGYSSLMVVILMLGAVQLISLGILGEYIGRLYMETKARPIYLVRDAIGFAGRRHGRCRNGDVAARSPRRGRRRTRPGAGVAARAGRRDPALRDRRHHRHPGPSRAAPSWRRMAWNIPGPGECPGVLGGRGRDLSRAVAVGLPRVPSQPRPPSQVPRLGLRRSLCKHRNHGLGRAGLRPELPCRLRCSAGDRPDHDVPD